ncbi:SRPBCC domain-containing protein [Nitratireductor sp. ZSWI3]|uniref:SRPBCC family protein n=1 Tax=Nitratireductor sp. ZSWI3 TaxID=2966359 RepID=UPI00214FD311|nr:SRPBCC domain-containing protein [Nitratireductor sp. ZSWI3]MCR4269115.1 SRPBCC domain-containing protein [Nitratireductor sp. ZSWI3]
MPDILHRVGIKSSSPDATYNALATIQGLTDWWTYDTKGESRTGGVIKFRFGSPTEPGPGFDMKVLELEPSKRVLWQVIDGPEEWIGTRVGFDLRQDDDYTIVLFRHEGWREPVEFMHHCSTKWALFLMSLKGLVETGKGAPHPDDVRIDNWK